MQFHLNIGLVRNDGKPDNTILRTVTVLNRFGFVLAHADVQQSDTEQTLCAAVQFQRQSNHRAVHDQLYAVCRELAQDCIAKASLDWTGKVSGELVGPEASAWGEFDSKYFLFPRHLEAA
ncbi:hypothetical protein [Burkholderia ubonensis]|uniref:hypothetical protein n=1 Tax=Burkholderia ubonensis TaxID=101571 RepID=UPI000751F84E|nr:hypothetical protein [Burkholderia ubonensis]KWK67212.1 hypothetical protein WM15_07340 [Burkholderia ubonensis]